MQAMRAVMADRRFSHAQARLLAVLIGQVNGRTGLTRASYRQLAATAGVSTSTVAGLLGDMDASPASDYLHAAEPGRNGAVCYRFVWVDRCELDGGGASMSDARTGQGASLTDAQASQGASASDARTEGWRIAQQCAAHRSLVQSASLSDAIRTVTYLSTYDPPTPLRGGARAAALEPAEAACRAATGAGLTASEKRRLQKECDGGAADLVADLTAASWRRGMRLAEKNNRPFGLGWVLRAERNHRLADRTRQSASDARDAGPPPPTEATTLRPRLKLWQRLSPERQEALREAARAELGDAAAEFAVIGRAVALAAADDVELSAEVEA